MMKILILSPVAPYPPNAGYPIVIYNDIVQLKNRGHEVRIVAVVENDGAPPEALTQLGQTDFVRVPKKPRWWRTLSNFGCPRPFIIETYFAASALGKIQDVVNEWSPDVVLAEDVAMASYALRVRDAAGIPFAVRGHNVDTQILERFVENSRNTVLRLAGRWQLEKMRAYEGSMVLTADAVSMITSEDAKTLRGYFPNANPAVVGAGTDLEKYRPGSEPRRAGTIVHVGSLTAFTKLEGMQWFVDNVLPGIRRRVPGASLELAGQVPAGAFDGKAGVTVLGRVDDEVPLLRQAAVFVAPQFVGSGVRLKILNALATGNAVVCTSVACEGIPVSHGVDALVCDDASAFEDAVVSVFNDTDLAASLGRNARGLAERLFDWRTIGAELAALLTSARREPESATRNLE